MQHVIIYIFLICSEDS